MPVMLLPVVTLLTQVQLKTRKLSVWQTGFALSSYLCARHSPHSQDEVARPYHSRTGIFRTDRNIQRSAQHATQA